MIKELISALRGSNKPRKDVVTRLVVNGEVYTDSDEVNDSSTRVVNYPLRLRAITIHTPT